MRGVSRRTVLHGALGAAVAAAVRPAFAKVQPITNELFLLGGFGGNVVALKTSDGTVAVDSGSDLPASPFPGLVAEATGDQR